MRLACRRVVPVVLFTALPLSLVQAQSRPRLFPVPVIGYAPETSLMLGVALVGVMSGDSARPSTALLTTIYTLKSQYSAGLSIDRWTRGDLWHLAGGVSAERFPSEFNGLGDVGRDFTISEFYTPQRVSLMLAAQRRIAPHLYAGAGWAIRDGRMVATDSGGLLRPGIIPGSRGGTPAILTLEADWDARDALYMPRRGTYLRLAWGVAGRAVGSNFAYTRLTADGRWFRQLGAKTVLAAQAVMDAVDGTAPFDQLPHLGGEAILRGFKQPRYTDAAMSAAQLELRTPLKGFVGLAFFGGAGATASRPGGLPGATWRPAGGAGLRILVDRANGLQVRFDFAFAPGGGGLYIGAGDAF